jgi:hypothetical protein
VAAGNPAQITSISDLRERGARVATRQEGSGSALLFSKLVADAGFKVEDLALTEQPVTSETDIAIAVREGKADAGLAIEAVAREQDWISWRCTASVSTSSSADGNISNRRCNASSISHAPTPSGFEPICSAATMSPMSAPSCSIRDSRRAMPNFP